MNIPQAIVVSAGILAGTFLLSAQAPSRADFRPGEGRYQIAATPGQSVANAWRLDRRTGEVFRCFATGGIYGAVCRKARFLSLDPGPSGGPAPDSAAFSLARF